MSSISWEDLKTSDTELAWTACSVEMSKSFFSSDMVVVPDILEANYYDLLVCFSKPNPKGNYIWDNISKFWKNKEDVDFILHGHISDLIKRPNTNIKALAQASKNTIAADIDPTQSDVWETKTDGIHKQIKIDFQGMSKEVINWAQFSEGDLVLERALFDLEGRRTLFIITEVVYAKKVSIEAIVDGKINTQESSGKIPIAFSYMKFPIDKFGILKQAQDTEVKISATFDIKNYTEVKISTNSDIKN